MDDAPYTPTATIDVTIIDGDEVDYQYWEGENLSPLPDARPPRFPRRVDYAGRDDGGWLEMTARSAYAPCGCCLHRPCLPQCPVQAHPAPRPGFWEQRWERTAREMQARGQEVAPRYQQL